MHTNHSLHSTSLGLLPFDLQAAGGLTIGVLPGVDPGEVSAAIDVPIVTGMGSGRDNINALSGDVMLAVGIGPGTAAEISLALKAGARCMGFEGTAGSWLLVSVPRTPCPLCPVKHLLNLRVA